MAREAVRVEQHAYGLDALALNDLLAAGADLPELLVVMERAVGLLLVLKELPAGEVDAALRAAQALGVPRPHERHDRPPEDGLPAPGADVLHELGVADQAVVLPVVLLAVPPDELGAARLAAVVLGMDLLPVEDHVVAQDGLLALGADVVLPLTQAHARRAALHAVRVPLVLLVLGAEKRRPALGARKVLGVVETVLELDALVENRLLARVAHVPKVLVVAVLAVNIAFLFHEGL